MKVRVNAARCQGHAMCALACSDVFKLSDEDGHAYVPREDVPAALEERVRRAKLSCPEDAIEIVT